MSDVDDYRDIALTLASWTPGSGWRACMDYLRGHWPGPAWTFQQVDELPFSQYVLQTEGDPGRESLVGGLWMNAPFWADCWWVAQRGGVYVFRVPTLGNDTQRDDE